MKKYHRFPGDRDVLFCVADEPPATHDDSTGPWDCVWCALDVPLADEVSPEEHARLLRRTGQIENNL